MPRASKRFLDDRIWKEIHDTLSEVLSSFEKKDLKGFLFEFLTREEKTMLAKRLTLYLMVLGGYSEPEIKEALKVSHETIRISKEALESKSKKFKDSLADWLKKPKKASSTNQLVKMLDLALSAKSDRKARAKLLSGDY